MQQKTAKIGQRGFVGLDLSPRSRLTSQKPFLGRIHWPTDAIREKCVRIPVQHSEVRRRPHRFSVLNPTLTLLHRLSHVYRSR